MNPMSTTTFPHGAPGASTDPEPATGDAAVTTPARDAEAERGDGATTANGERRGRALWILGGVAAAIAIGVFVLWLVSRGKESTDDAQVEADVVPVAPQVGGRLVKVVVAENQHVKRGDLIAQVDDADYHARVQQAEGELAEAEAQAAQAASQETVVQATARGGLAGARAALSESAVSVRSAEAQIAAARAVVDRARVESRNADLELERARRLREDNAIPQQQLDAAQLAADSARAALTQAKAGLATAQEERTAAESRVAEARSNLTKSAPIEAQVAAARAATELAEGRVTAARAALTLAKLQLEYTRVVAADHGVVSHLGAHAGQLVSAGQTMAQLVPDRVYVVANFKETQIAEMRPGTRARVSVDAYPHRDFEAKVESLSAGTGARFSLLPPDNASGNFVKVVQRVPVRIAFVDPPTDAPLRAGLSADVTVYVR